MTTIHLEQTDCLHGYQFFEKYFKNTPLADCGDFTFSVDSSEIYSAIESSNHSQLLIQRLLIGANPSTLSDLFNFFCKNTYIEVKPCCDFYHNSKGEYHLYFIGHNDNRSLFGESATMMFNFVATAIIQNIDPQQKKIDLKLTFKGHLPSEREYDDLSLTQKVKIHTVKRIANRSNNNIQILIENVNSFMKHHELIRGENEEILQIALKEYSEKIQDNGLPLAYMASTVRMLSNDSMIELYHSKAVQEVENWIKGNPFFLNFNYDLEFYSEQIDHALKANELFELVKQKELDEFLHFEWFAIIHPMPTEQQVENFLK